jgi:hypothetical protein
MTKESDYLAKALDLAEHAKRTRDEGERARLFALAVKYRELAIAKAFPFLMATPKRPAASWVQWRHPPSTAKKG